MKRTLAAALVALAPALAAAEGQIVLTPNPLNMTANGTADMTLTLSEPALSGLLVSLSASTGIVTVPDELFIEPGEVSVQFAVDAGEVAGADEITAEALGFASGTAAVAVAEEANPCRARVREAIQAAHDYVKAARRVPPTCRDPKGLCKTAVAEASIALETLETAHQAVIHFCLTKK